MDAAQPQPVPIPIAEDLSCIQCQYNLRTRIPTDLCPECGLPVFKSQSHHRIHAGALVRPALFRAAAPLFAVIWFLDVPLFAAVYGLILYQGSSPNPRAVAAAILLVNHGSGLLLAAALAIGILLAGRSIGTAVVPVERRAQMAILASGFVVVHLVKIMLVVMILHTAARGRWFRGFYLYRMLRYADVVSAGTYLILIAAGFVMMRHLAKALASPRLSRYTNAAFIAQLIDGILGLCVSIWLAARGRAGTTEDQDKFLFSVDLFSVMISVSFGFYWLLVARHLGINTGNSHNIKIEERDMAYEAQPSKSKVSEFLSHPESPPSVTPKPNS